jgi:hypothetical protein
MMCNSHDDIPKSGEHSALLWLGEEIGNHLPRWTVHETDVSSVDPVFDEEVTDVDVS